ncbi:hypothetical protein QFX20_12940 [Lampropedia aestuarii]|nr:hypothetical protein [Lampropedia aestuarii]
MIQERPQALKQFLAVLANSSKEALAQPVGAIVALKSKDVWLIPIWQSNAITWRLIPRSIPLTLEWSVGPVRPKRLNTMDGQASNISPKPPPRLTGRRFGICSDNRKIEPRASATAAYKKPKQKPQHDVWCFLLNTALQRHRFNALALQA